MVKEQESELLKNAELSRAKAEAELSALKNQIDPHFMFNTLNNLSYLISTDPIRAALFTESLAEVYRYILNQKNSTLVLLEDELAFTHQYAALLHLRFGDALRFNQSFNGELDRQFLIPPTSVFVALENAVKHNEISEKCPLQVSIDVKDKKLIISNPVQAKRNLADSPGIGLKNLDERFKIATGTGITSGTTDNIFEVTMPLISLES